VVVCLHTNTVRILDRHGLADGLHRGGREHSVCEFRTEDGRFRLDYGALGQQERHAVYPQQELVTDLLTRYLFDQSMAASSRMFEPLAAHPVITAAGRAPALATVVDIAGGNGELLGHLLGAHPRLRGVLLERPHVVEAARRSLAAAGLGARCDCLPGDFADVPPGGDVYLLSRVLHDWDDERCREILRGIAHAMPASADLLIVERVLPGDGSASLATAWDLHMMCNVGGRERRADHYARLLADAGLALVDVSPLPLDACVLHARKVPAQR
jgi:hypothetical protein